MGGKSYVKSNFYIKYFDKIKCYADRPYLVFSELKPETHIFFFWPKLCHSLFMPFVCYVLLILPASNLPRKSLQVINVSELSLLSRTLLQILWFII